MEFIICILFYFFIVFNCIIFLFALFILRFIYFMFVYNLNDLSNFIIHFLLLIYP